MGVGGSMNHEILSIELKHRFRPKVQMEMRVGRFLVKTISNSDELLQAFALRFQVFQVEMMGSGLSYGLDTDRFDISADHLAIFDGKSGQMIATCRLNSSAFTEHFYSEQEFNCDSLLARPEPKLEIGRVCVHRNFRKGAIILWLCFGEYIGRPRIFYFISASPFEWEVEIRHWNISSREILFYGI
jgi:putative hemolysin